MTILKSDCLPWYRFTYKIRLDEKPDGADLYDFDSGLISLISYRIHLFFYAIHVCMIFCLSPNDNHLYFFMRLQYTDFRNRGCVLFLYDHKPVWYTLTSTVLKKLMSCY